MKNECQSIPPRRSLHRNEDKEMERKKEVPEVVQDKLKISHPPA